MSTPTRRGSATVVAGTSGLLPDAPAALIVKSVKWSSKDETNEIQGNTGFTSITIDYHDGFDADIEVVEDTGAAAPAEDDVINILHPKTGVAVKADVTKSSKSNDRKTEGSVSFTARYRPDRDPGDVSWPIAPPAP